MSCLRMQLQRSIPAGVCRQAKTFADITELKQILSTSQRESVLRNIVEKTMSYALCRRLKIHDRPTDQFDRGTDERNQWHLARPVSCDRQQRRISGNDIVRRQLERMATDRHREARGKATITTGNTFTAATNQRNTL